MTRKIILSLLTLLILNGLNGQVDCETIVFGADAARYESYGKLNKMPIAEKEDIDRYWCYVEKSGNDSLKTIAYRLYGEMYYELFDLAKAKKYLTLAIENAEKYGQHVHKCGSLHMLGHTYFQLQNFDFSLYLQKKFLEEAIEHNLEGSISTGYIVVGFNYYKVGKFKKAKTYLKHAIDNFKFEDYNKFHYNSNMRIAHLYLGTTYDKLGDAPKSKYHLEKSLEGFTMIDDRRKGYLEIYLGNALFYLDKGDLANLERILAEIESISDFDEVTRIQPRFSCQYYNLKGDYYNLLKQKEQAAFYHNEAFELSKEKGFHQILLKSANSLMDYYADKNPQIKDYYLNETQRFLFNIYEKNLDNIGLTNLSKSLQLESEKIGILIKERDLLVDKSKTRNIVIVTLVIIISILAIMFYYLLNFHHKTVIQKDELQKVHQTLDIAYENLRTTNNKLMRSNNDLYNFAAIIAHDLKSPLRAISFFSNEIYRQMKTTISEENNENFNLIISSSKKMTLLIDALLSFSKVTADLPEPETIDLRRVLDDTKLFRGLTITKDVKIDCDDNLGKIKGHSSLLDQLFFNLISNSIKFTPLNRNPQIYVSIDYEDDKELCISIQDNGAGIPKNYLPYIFTIFKTYHFDGCQPNEGSGIGLSICKRIVEYYNGKIWASSVVGEGTKIFFTLSKKEFDEDGDRISQKSKSAILEHA